MKASKAILYSTSGFLVVIWLSSFIISYVSLVAVAAAGGLTYPWVWLWPLLLDAFMCIGSLDVIRRELNSEPTTIAWAVVIGVTLVSTGFNITRADPSVLSWAVHALAPVVCFLSFEVEMGVLRSYFRQIDKISESESSDKIEKIDKKFVNNFVKDFVKSGEKFVNNFVKTDKKNTDKFVKGFVKADKIDKIVNDETGPDVPVITTDSRRNTRKDIANYYREHPEAGYAEVGKAVGVSRQVVRYHVKNLSTLTKVTKLTKSKPLTKSLTKLTKLSGPLNVSGEIIP